MMFADMEFAQSLLMQA